jgi:hypothetical protein
MAPPELSSDSSDSLFHPPSSLREPTGRGVRIAPQKRSAAGASEVIQEALGFGFDTARTIAHEIRSIQRPPLLRVPFCFFHFAQNRGRPQIELRFQTFPRSKVDGGRGEQVFCGRHGLRARCIERQRQRKSEEGHREPTCAGRATGAICESPFKPPNSHARSIIPQTDRYLNWNRVRPHLSTNRATGSQENASRWGGVVLNAPPSASKSFDQ